MHTKVISLMQEAFFNTDTIEILHDYCFETYGFQRSDFNIILEKTGIADLPITDFIKLFADYEEIDSECFRINHFLMEFKKRTNYILVEGRRVGTNLEHYARDYSEALEFFLWIYTSLNHLCTKEKHANPRS